MVFVVFLYLQLRTMFDVISVPLHFKVGIWALSIWYTPMCQGNDPIWAAVRFPAVGGLDFVSRPQSRTSSNLLFKVLNSYLIFIKTLFSSKSSIIIIIEFKKYITTRVVCI